MTVTSYTNKPFAGLAIAMRCAAVTRGIKTPFVVEVRSNTADAFADIAPTATLTEFAPVPPRTMVLFASTAAFAPIAVALFRPD